MVNCLREKYETVQRWFIMKYTDPKQAIEDYMALRITRVEGPHLAYLEHLYRSYLENQIVIETRRLAQRRHTLKDLSQMKEFIVKNVNHSSTKLCNIRYFIQYFYTTDSA